MRLLGIIMAAFGFAAAAFNLVMGGGRALMPMTVWGVVCIIGVIIVAKNPRRQKKTE
jgi:hypothetical protein